MFKIAKKLTIRMLSEDDIFLFWDHCTCRKGKDKNNNTIRNMKKLSKKQTKK